MRLCSPKYFFVFALLASALHAQSTAVPTAGPAIPAQTLVAGGSAVTLNLQNHFSVPNVTGPVVQFETILGRINVELRSDIAPRHATNFLAYVDAGRYANTFFHRAATFDGGAMSIIQGGGYRSLGGSNVSEVQKFPAVALEYNTSFPNARGTLAAARTSAPDSATSEWFFNVRDNTTNLNEANGGGYSVFGEVIGAGMTVVDAIAALNRVAAGGAFGELPVRNYTTGTPTADNLAIVQSISRATLFPTGGGRSVVSFELTNSAPNTVQTTLSGSTLTLAGTAGGTANLTVRALDGSGGSAQHQFTVTVTVTAPSFTSQPRSVTIASGSTVVFSAPATGVPTYQWRKDGTNLAGATGATLVINNATAANAGVYSVVATNSVGATTSNSATLTVSTVSAASVGRLANLSVLTDAGAGDQALTVGAVVGPISGGGSMPLLARAVGPTLGQPPFTVPAVLADPVLSLYNRGAATPLASNDDWGGTAELQAAFTAVGAFALPANSLDSALLRTSAAGDYVVQIGGKGTATGRVIAEFYDATGSARTASSPRLVNLSVLKRINAGAMLTAGFVIGGQTARTVLIRAIGPGLEAFGVGDRMSDPALSLFGVGQVKLQDNDNWGGDLNISNLGNAVGAFAVTNAASRDAMLVTTLAPGDYTVEVRAADSGGGFAIVEVYEVP